MTQIKTRTLSNQAAQSTAPPAKFSGKVKMRVRNSPIWRGAKGNSAENGSTTTTKSEESDNTAKIILPTGDELKVTITFHKPKTVNLKRLLKLKHTQPLDE
jgi:hypothetical protein